MNSNTKRAISRAVVALYDWMKTYVSQLCYDRDVEKSRKIISKKSVYGNHWHRVRKRFIDRALKEKGGLVCSMCKKKLQNTNPEKNEDYVTIDHIIPLRDGGDLKDFDNLRLACRKCNTKRDETRRISLE